MAWTEQLASGRYRGGYRIPGGEKRYTVETFNRERDAKRKATALEEESRSPGWHDPRAAQRPWREWADEWFDKRVVNDSTRRRDLSRMKRLHTKWDDTPLNEITRFAVKSWAAEMLAEGLAPATVLRSMSLLSASLTAAADAEILPANPALRLKLGLVCGVNERTLSVDEQHRLFAAFETDFDRALVATLLGSGGRWGEVVALGAQHFSDLGIRYRRAWDVTNRQLIDHTKGKRHRTVPLAPWLDELTLPLRKARPKGYLFAAPTGNPIDYSNWHRLSWTPAVEAAGLNDGSNDDDVTIHTLRHTYATEQLEDGRTIGEIADLLGHKSMAMAERYAHRRRSVSPAAANAVRDPRSAPDKPLPPNVTRVDFGRRGA